MTSYVSSDTLDRKPPRSPSSCPLSPLCACGDCPRSIEQRRDSEEDGGHRSSMGSALRVAIRGDKAMFGRNGNKLVSDNGDGTGKLASTPSQIGTNPIIQAE